MCLSSGQLGGTPIGEVFRADGLQPALCGGAGGGPALALAAGGVGDVGGDAHVREEQRLLGQHGDTARVGGHENPCAGVGDDHSAEFDPAVVGPQQPGDHQQQGGLAYAVGSEHGEHLAVLEREVEFDAALLESGLHPHAAHTGPASRRLAEAITMIAATTMSNNDRATAASGSVSRCR